MIIAGRTVLASLAAIAMCAWPGSSPAIAAEAVSAPVLIMPGLFTKSRNPGCIGGKMADPSARCERVCVTIPVRARIQRVDYFLKETYDQTFTMVQPDVEMLPWAKVSGNFTVDRFSNGQEVCSMFMNWAIDRNREAQIKVTYSE
jgi:hypothetical protein